MVFSSLFFLFAFLPATLLAYYAAPARCRNRVALAASCFFYAWGAPRFLFVLLASSALDYAVSHRLRDSDQPPARRRRLLALALTWNLALLGYFKYANFLVAELNRLLERLGAPAAPWTAVALPIGISFFTFQKISYLVDVYRGTAQPARSLGDYWLFVVLFPQLIAGPIVRYHDLAAQLVERRPALAPFCSGIWRFCAGLAKKVLIANTLGEVADRAFGAEAAALTPLQAWLGAWSYAFQIYFDFSGYSDMAIGLGRFLGFEFLENFDRPYLARSFTEFWRRWHISLSNFMREYLYLPLGGNRAGTLRTYRNLWIVFLLSGFWHGAAWNFIVWGAYHGLFLTLEKLLLARGRRPLPAALAMPGTFLLVTLGWVFFRAASLADAVRLLSRLWPFGTAAVNAPRLADFFPPQAATALAAAALLSFAPLVLPARPALALRAPRLTAALAGATAILLLALSACALAAGQFNPFIYFRF